MFKTAITSSPLISETANDVFQNIQGDSFIQDMSFVATLRALVAPRMADSERIFVHFTASNYNDRQMERFCKDDKKYIAEAVFELPYIASGTIVIHNCVGESSGKTIELANNVICEGDSKWHKLEKVTEFYRKQFSVSCFINPETKSVLIVTENLDYRRLHYLQCSIFAFLPWYFDPQKGVTELEMELIKSLREKTPDKYEECIEKIAEQYDLENERIRKLLAGFETVFERREKENVSRAISDIDYQISRLYESVADYMRRRRDQEIKLLGLEAKINSDDNTSEIMEYFLSNKNVHLERVSDSTMSFVATGYLEFFDEDMVESVINNKSSYVYRPHGRRECNNIISEDDIKLFMKSVFLDQKLKIRFCAAYRFEFGSGVAALSGYTFGSKFKTYMPNTHINTYSCMGNYRMAISKLVQENNYIMAIEQCIASCKSLNFGDATVMNEFMETIYGLAGRNVNNLKFVELPDGSVVTPKEAIAYLKSEVNGDE